MKTKKEIQTIYHKLTKGKNLTQKERIEMLQEENQQLGRKLTNAEMQLTETESTLKFTLEQLKFAQDICKMICKLPEYPGQNTVSSTR